MVICHKIWVLSPRKMGGDYSWEPINDKFKKKIDSAEKLRQTNSIINIHFMLHKVETC